MTIGVDSVATAGEGRLSGNDNARHSGKGEHLSKDERLYGWSPKVAGHRGSTPMPGTYPCLPVGDVRIATRIKRSACTETASPAAESDGAIVEAENRRGPKSKT